MSEKLSNYGLPRRFMSVKCRCFVHEVFIEVPLFQESSPVLKISGLRTYGWCFQKKVYTTNT